MGKIIGIDLGTTNSVVAVVEGGEPTVITSAEGGRTIPSCVAFTKDGKKLVGQLAKRQAVLNLEGTVLSIKRHMGEKDYKVTLQGKAYRPEEISAFVLQKIKSDAESYLGQKVEKAVITVPAYFNDAQRQATKDAGKIAGLDVVRIINEPTAASLAYGLDKKKAETILVFDLGGGTFDVSILEVGEGVFEVKSTAGDTHLGGDDYDQKLVDYIADEFKKDQGIDLRNDKQALQRLTEAAEKAKCELSTVMEATISLPFITADQSGPKHLEMKITRAKFDQLTQELTERCKGPFMQAVEDAKLSSSNIDEVILVGGSTRMPVIQNLIRELTGKDAHKGINPDEVVAVGAAIQAAVLGGEMKDIVLLDVTPLTLGVETLGNVCTPMIPRNTTVPTKKTEVFTTAEDNQSSVEIHVLQGERKMARDNKSLGQFHLDGIPPAPRGVPQIEVTFDIDANGILHASAKDKATGKEQTITITGSSTLSKEDVDKMVKEAEAHAEDDRKVQDVIEARNKADQLIYTIEKSLKDTGDKVPAEEKAKVEEAIKKLKEEMQQDDAQKIRTATDELSQASHAIAQYLYQQAQQQQTAEPAPDTGNGETSGEGEAPSEPSSKGEDEKDVVEGEYRPA